MVSGTMGGFLLPHKQHLVPVQREVFPAAHVNPVGGWTAMLPDELVEGGVFHEPGEPSHAGEAVRNPDVGCLALDVLGEECSSHQPVQSGATVSAADDYGLFGIEPQGFQHLLAELFQGRDEPGRNMVVYPQLLGLPGAFKLLQGKVFAQSHRRSS